MDKHPRDMTRDELLEIVFGMSWAALDLSQHLRFTNDMLREELRPAAYKRAAQMAGEICQMPYTPHAPRNETFDVVLFGENALERIDPFGE